MTTTHPLARNIEDVTPNRAAVASDLKTYALPVYSNAADVQSDDLALTPALVLAGTDGTAKLFVYDSSESGSHDGTNIIVDENSRRFVYFDPAQISVRTRLPNQIINGGFDIWQRGTLFTSTGYTADRWRLELGTGAAITLTRQSFTLGQTSVPGSPVYYLRMVRGTAGSAASKLETRLERLRQYSAAKVTLTFWAKASAATVVSSQVNQKFGSGGSPSADVASGGQNHSLTTNWQKFSRKLTLASLTGKTFGTNNDDFLQVLFSWAHTSNATGTIEIARVSLCFGDTTDLADPFAALPLRHELAACQRFYCRSSGYGFMVTAASATTLSAALVMPVAMRAAPTAALLDTSPVFAVAGTDETGSSSSITAQNSDDKGALVTIDGFTGLTAGEAGIAKNPTAIFEFSAEL